MFTRKPKNIVQHVMQLTNKMDAQEASHTWMNKDSTRASRFGSTSTTSYDQRRQADRERKLIARYGDSKIGTYGRSQRGEIQRLNRTESKYKISQPNSPISPLPQPSTTAPKPFYPEMRPKL